jgi:hypothetical protein
VFGVETPAKTVACKGLGTHCYQTEVRDLPDRIWSYDLRRSVPIQTTKRNSPKALISPEDATSQDLCSGLI